jgi:hypothetical protein
MQETPLATCFVLSARWNIKIVRTPHYCCGTRISSRLEATGPRFEESADILYSVLILSPLKGILK